MRVEGVFLVSMYCMLNFWGYTSHIRDHYHLMVTLKGIFNGDMGGKCHMFPLVDVTDSYIEMSKLVVRWL